MDSFVDIIEVQGDSTFNSQLSTLNLGLRPLALLRQTALLHLDKAWHELHEITNSHDWYMLNGCSEEKYQEFCRMHQQEVEDWKAINTWLEKLKVNGK